MLAKNNIECQLQKTRYGQIHLSTTVVLIHTWMRNLRNHYSSQFLSKDNCLFISKWDTCTLYISWHKRNKHSGYPWLFVTQGVWSPSPHFNRTAREITAVRLVGLLLTIPLPAGYQVHSILSLLWVGCNILLGYIQVLYCIYRTPWLILYRIHWSI